MPVPRTRASLVCQHEKSILVFKGIDPLSKKEYWFLPGGKVEPQEKPWQCAKRETLEETGYQVDVDRASELVKEYQHEWNGQIYECKTYFYKGTLRDRWTAPKEVRDVDYNKGAHWLPVHEALKYFGYTKEIKEAVVTLIKT